MKPPDKVNGKCNTSAVCALCALCVCVCVCVTPLIDEDTLGWRHGSVLSESVSWKR
jgi:uncharacterized phage-associated protein